jgi:serine protease
MKRMRTLVLVLAALWIAPGISLAQSAMTKLAPQPPLPPDTPVYAIVVKFHDDAGVRMGNAGRLTQKAVIAKGVPLGPLQASFSAIEAQARSRGLALKRHFDLQTEEALDLWVARGKDRSGRALADLNSFYSMPLPAGTRYSQVADLVRKLASQPYVEAAYAATLAKPGQGAASPDFEGDQDYLDPGPNGIDARYGWTLPGGRGASVLIVDVEYAWNRAHEDLPAPFVDRNNDFLDPANGFTDDHGTAVVGVLAALNNDVGGTGIVSDADVGLSSVQPQQPNQVSVAAAIQWAAERVNAGDFILIEQQVFGPSSGTCACVSCPNYLPVEWELANFNAIQAATANGIIVVEAAANGSMNLDAPVYNNLFNRNTRDSGAILVGAGMSTARGWMCTAGEKMCSLLDMAIFIPVVRRTPVRGSSGTRTISVAPPAHPPS